MINNKNSLTIVTPYYPSEANRSGGIFIYEQLPILARKFESINVFILRPKFSISRRKPFIKSNKADKALLDTGLDNVRIKVVEHMPFPKDTIGYFKNIARAIKPLLRNFSDNVLAHTVCPAGVALDILGVNQVIVVHGSDLRYFVDNLKQKEFMIRAFERAKQIVPVSQGLREDIENLGIESNKIRVIENGIKTGTSILPSYTESIKFKFVFVGSLITQKGVYELINAFMNMDCHSCCELYFIGDGPEAENLKKIAGHHNGETIHFKGALSNDEVMKELQGMDCLVLPSYKEGFGRVIIEMMNCGKPVISTYSGGPEYIINDNTGLLVQPEDPEGLKAAMKKISEGHHRYKSEDIRNYVAEHYDLEKQTVKLAELFK